MPRRYAPQRCGPLFAFYAGLAEEAHHVEQTDGRTPSSPRSATGSSSPSPANGSTSRYTSPLPSTTSLAALIVVMVPG